MIPILLLLLSPFARADESWLCQCFENDHSLREASFVSLDLDLTLKEAETRSLKTCRSHHARVKYTFARCIVHNSAGEVGAAPSVPSSAPKPRTFEALTASQQTEVKEAYKKVLNAHEKHDFATMIAEADHILTYVNDYNDTRSYKAIAERGLEQTKGH